MRQRVVSSGAKFVLLAVVAGASILASACNALLDFDAFRIPNADAGGCIDPAGFGNRGCFRCPPTTNEEHLNACTGSTFEPFDNSQRIVGFDPASPKPEAPDGGAWPADYVPPSSDGGTSDPPPGSCGALPSNAVMVYGATGFPMNAIAQAMGPSATLYFLEASSCFGVKNVIDGSQKVTGTVVRYDPTSGAATKCVLADEHPADVNLSALFAETCARQAGLGENVQLPAGVEDFLGPVNPVMFAAPASSKELVISAEAAYRIYGFLSASAGTPSGVAPWSEEDHVFRRSGTSGVQQTIARTLGLSPDALRGRNAGSSSNMRSALQTSDDPDKTLGISSSEIVDVNRSVMKSLAYQHVGQTVGFYPDSAPGAFDRRNVRDGHYFLWIPLHILAKTDAGDPVAAVNTILDPDGTLKATRDAAVRSLVLVMANRIEPPVKSVNLFTAIKAVGNVPQCAMRVQRTREGSPLTAYAPSTKCACAFEATSPGSPPAECKTCTDANPCVDGKTCTFGYCE